MCKKKVCFLIVLVFVIFLSGCTKFNSDMTIKKDKSMDFSILYTYDGVNDPLGIVNGDNRQKLLNSGYVIEDYKNGNSSGIKITREIDNIDDVSEENKLVKFDLFSLIDDNDNLKLFKVEKNFLFDAYTAKFYISNRNGILNGDENIEDTDNGQKHSYNKKKWGSSDNFKFSLSVPYLVGENNATNISGNRRKLSWDLSEVSSLSTIEFKFYMIKKKDALILLAAIVLFIMFVISTRGNNNLQNDSDDDKVTASKKETYQTPINIPSTPVTTGEVENSQSFDFLNSDSGISKKEEVANDIFDIKTDSDSTDDVNFIMSSQLHGDSENNKEKSTTSYSNGITGLEEFMNNGSTVSEHNIDNNNNNNNTSNNNDVKTPIEPPLNSDGGIPELMSNVDENNSIDNK